VTPPRLFGRISARRASHSYGYVLALIIASFLFAATAPDAPWATSVLVLLESLTLVAALWTSALTGMTSGWNIGLLSIAVVAAVVNIVSSGKVLAGLVGILSGVLAIGVIVVLGRAVVLQGEVNAQSITAAVCVYILFGLIFLFIYSVSAEFGHGPFFAQGTDGTRSLRLYFSYVTLATIGYGDYTPKGNLGHTFAVVEALVGQLYLVTVVALLVARMRPHGAA
jgi:hypothetical protein